MTVGASDQSSGAIALGERTRASRVQELLEVPWTQLKHANNATWSRAPFVSLISLISI
jgi:hypothetical protein